MPLYRIYSLNRANMVSAAHSVECVGDDEASDEAIRLLDEGNQHKIEVWHEARQVSSHIKEGAAHPRLRADA
jgi:hypothetical protein